MTRARSGSFYCPIPEQTDLSIAQKAEISTAHAPLPPSNNSSLVGGRLRRHSRTPAVSECPHHSIGVFTKPAHAPLVRTPSSLGTSTPTGGKGEIHQVAVLATAQKQPTTTQTSSDSQCSLRPKSSARQYPWSPIRHSLLNTSATPQCPSAQWIQRQSEDAYTLQLPLAYRTSALECLAHPSPSLLRSTLRSRFLCGPMAEKARIYGLRVAWCVYGDVKEILAKEIFVSGARAGYSRRRSSDSSTCSLRSEDTVEVVRPETVTLETDVSTGTSAAFEWSVQDPFSKQPFLGSVDEMPALGPMDSDEEDTEDSEDSLSEYSTLSEDSDVDPDISLDDLLEYQHDFELDFDFPGEQVA